MANERELRFFSEDTLVLSSLILPLLLAIHFLLSSLVEACISHHGLPQHSLLKKIIQKREDLDKRGKCCFVLFQLLFELVLFELSSWFVNRNTVVNANDARLTTQQNIQMNLNLQFGKVFSPLILCCLIYI